MTWTDAEHVLGVNGESSEKACITQQQLAILLTHPQALAEIEMPVAKEDAADLVVEWKVEVLHTAGKLAKYLSDSGYDRIEIELHGVRIYSQIKPTLVKTGRRLLWWHQTRWEDTPRLFLSGHQQEYWTDTHAMAFTKMVQDGLIQVCQDRVDTYRQAVISGTEAMSKIW